MSNSIGLTTKRAKELLEEYGPNVIRIKSNDNSDIKIFGLQKGNKRTKRYVNKKLINDPNLNNWKVFIPESNGSGAIGTWVGKPIIGEPLTGCTGSFIQIGSFKNTIEAQNCIKYIKTKFCRAMLGTLKVTQDNPKSVWKNIPLQNFTNKSDIDWSKSISEIDQQLYKKYGLSEDEIAFIEGKVQPMV